jgi:hypothetical protein
MNLRFQCIIAAIAVLLCALPASAFYGTFPVGNDLWDVNQGGVVTGSSAMLSGSNASDMIGAAEGSVEAGTGLFADNYPIGQDHWLRWTTPTNVTVGDFKVYAAHDGGESAARSFDYFTLRAIPLGGTDYVTIYETAIDVPYVLEDEFGGLLFSHKLSVPVTAHQFEAHFRQHTEVAYAMGPRVVELDAFAALPVPEPGGLLAVSSAIISLAGFAHRRRQR